MLIYGLHFYSMCTWDICCSYLICTAIGIILKSQKNNLPQLYFNIIIVEFIIYFVIKFYY